jgi:hypothetical protein
MIASSTRKIDFVTRHLRFSPSKSMEEIGRIAGVSPSYVSQINRDLKIRTQTKAGPRANISEMEALALADLQAALADYETPKDRQLMLEGYRRAAVSLLSEVGG